MNYREKFWVEPGSKVSLRKIDPDYKDKHEDKESADAEITEQSQKMRDLQYMIYAENRRSLLICLQAPDAAGKDGRLGVPPDIH